VDEFCDLLDLLYEGSADERSELDESSDDGDGDVETDEGDTGDSVLPEAGNVRAVEARSIRTASVGGGMRERRQLELTGSETQKRTLPCPRDTRGKK